MSKSVERVRAALEAAGLAAGIREMPADTRTAQMAAAAAGCELDQIAKSIIFQGTRTGGVYLFITAGGNRVNEKSAAALAGEELGRADAHLVRKTTGFAIGGVSPIGHLDPVPAYFDRTLLKFAIIWAAAGTPRHIFPISPVDLQRISSAQLSDFT